MIQKLGMEINLAAQKLDKCPVIIQLIQCAAREDQKGSRIRAADPLLAVTVNVEAAVIVQAVLLIQFD